MNALATIAESPRPARQIVEDVVPMLDTGRFEHMQRIATVMANTSLMPEALQTYKDDDGKVQFLPFERIVANSFLVVNQSVRWGMDPFAVAQCVSIVKGKLCYEGKLVAAVLDAKLGISLDYTYDDKSGEQLGVIVSGTVDGRVKTVSGTVAAWKTTGSGSPWNPATFKRQLAYRGAREWARMHKPALMLGAYTEDELADLSEASRASNARDITHRSVVNPLEDAGPARLAAPAKSAAPSKPAAVTETIAPDDILAELERRLSAAKSSGEIETAFTDVTVGNKLYKAAGYMDRARALKAEFLAGIAEKPRKSAETTCETAAEAIPPGRSAAQDAGVSLDNPVENAPASAGETDVDPDAILANLIDCMAMCQTIEAIEEGYDHLDVEAELAPFSDYVERARNVKASHLDRVERLTSAAQSDGHDELPPPPPADDTSPNTEPDLSTPEVYEDFLQAKLAAASDAATYQAVRDWWTATRSHRQDVLGIKDHADIARLQGYFGARKSEIGLA